MPDAAAAPATPVAAPAPAAPAAAAPTTPEPSATETPAPSTPQTRTKTSDAQRVAAAAKLLEKAGSAKESGAPPVDEPGEAEAPADPAAKAKGGKDLPDPEEPHEIANAEWKEYRNRVRKVVKKEQTLQAKEQEYASKDMRYQQWDQRISAFLQREQLLKQNPREYWALVAKESGSDFTKEYEKLANAYLEDGKPDSRLAAAEQRLQQVERERLQERAQLQHQNLEAQKQNALRQFFAVAATPDYPSTQLTLKRNGHETVVADALAVGQFLTTQFGRQATDAEIAKELDAQYEKHYKELVASHPRLTQPQPGVTERVNGAGQSATPVAPKAPTTLTNGGSAVRAAPGRKLSESERIAAAAEHWPDSPRPRAV